MFDNPKDLEERANKVRSRILLDKGYEVKTIAKTIGVSLDTIGLWLNSNDLDEYNQPPGTQVKKALERICEEYENALHILSIGNLPHGESAGDYLDSIASVVEFTANTLHVDNIVAEFYHLINSDGSTDMDSISSSDQVNILIETLNVDYNSVIRHLVSYSLARSAE